MEQSQHTHEIGEIVLKLADVVDIAHAVGIAVPAQNRHVDRCTGIAQRLGKRMHASTVVGRPMNQHHHLRAAALISPIAECGAVARGICL